MKKTFKLAAIAVAASLALVACNNNTKPVEEAIDSTAIETVAVEPVIEEAVDTITNIVEEQAEAAKQTAKKAVKKAATEASKRVVDEANVGASSAKEAPKTDVKKSEAKTIKPKF
jgi:hypothetical protein